MSQFPRPFLAKFGAISVLILTGAQPGFADALDFLDGHVFLPQGGCERAGAAGQSIDFEGLDGDYLLVGGAEGRRFIATGWPGICTVDGILTPEMHGAGNGFATVMASVSCIDDTAVPVFEIAVFEFQPERDDATARVVVHALHDGDNGLNGEYMTCEGAARDKVDALYLHSSDPDAPG